MWGQQQALAVHAAHGSGLPMHANAQHSMQVALPQGGAHDHGEHHDDNKPKGGGQASPARRDPALSIVLEGGEEA